MPASRYLADFIELRKQVDQLAQYKAAPHTVRLTLPQSEAGNLRPEDVVEMGQVFKATLAAVAEASRLLGQPSTRIALGSQPVTMRLSARFAEIIPERGQVYIQINQQANRRKETKFNRPVAAPKKGSTTT